MQVQDEIVVGVGVLAIVNEGDWVAVTLAVLPGLVAAAPTGGVPLAVAVLLTDPVFRSAWVVVRVAVQVVVALGARVVAGQLGTDSPPS